MLICIAAKQLVCVLFETHIVCRLHLAADNAFVLVYDVDSRWIKGAGLYMSSVAFFLVELLSGRRMIRLLIECP